MIPTEPTYENYQSPKKVLKVLYIFIVLSLLWATLVYLDMLNQIALQNIVCLFLGFFTMLLIQMRIVSYFFHQKMKAYDLDQFGIIKDEIKSRLFGQINTRYITQKVKLKYYQQTKDQYDKLFSQDNQQTFDCVVTTLRAKNQVDHINKIRLLRQKWEIFLFRISQFEIFLTNLHKIYKERTLTHKKFIQKISFIKEQDYEKWEVLFQENNDQEYLPHNQYTKNFNQNHIGNDWSDMKKILWEKFHLVEYKTKQISSQLLTQFKAYANQMRTQHRQTLIQLQNSQSQNSLSKKNYREINQKIDATTKKINSVTEKIKKTKTKGAGNMQSIFNLQYDLRFLFIQLDNLQVRKTYGKDMNHKNSQNQYKLYLAKENSLQNVGIKKFNNRISHYLVSFYDKTKVLLPKIKQKQKYKKQNNLLNQNSNNNPRKTYDELSQVQKRWNQFKNYLPQLIKLHQEEIKSLKKIHQIIKDYQKQTKKSNTQSKYIQDTSITEKIIDNMFFGLLQSVNQKQLEILGKNIQLLRQQQSCMQRKQMMITQASTIKKNNIHELPDIPQLKAKSSKKENSVNQSLTSFLTLQQARQFQIKNKVNCFLNEILICMFQGYSIILNQIEQKKDQMEFKITSPSVIDPKILRMNQYKDELFKLQKEQFQREEEFGTKDQLQNNQKSLAILNKLLSVFFSEWKNSDFFHHIIKEQIEVSLNTKRPPLLGFMSVKYIKIHQKQGDVLENLSLLGENLFMCLFEASINFKGKIAIHIESQIKAKKIPVSINILITEFKCPIRICFTPFSLGKSYVSMMKTPKISAQFNAKIGNWDLAKIPFLSILIQIFIVIKLRKKFLYPKRATIKVPLAVKNAIAESIKQRIIYQKMIQKKMKVD